MTARFKDEVLPNGHRLRHYFKADEYGFPFEYRLPRFQTRAAAIAAMDALTERKRLDAVRASFDELYWRDLTDLRRCPECRAVVEVVDVLDHHAWHAEQVHP